MQGHESNKTVREVGGEEQRGEKATDWRMPSKYILCTLGNQSMNNLIYTNLKYVEKF
jgi:hypothetical protein